MRSMGGVASLGGTALSLAIAPLCCEFTRFVLHDPVFQKLSMMVGIRCSRLLELGGVDGLCVTIHMTTAFNKHTTRGKEQHAPCCRDECNSSIPIDSR